MNANKKKVLLFSDWYFPGYKAGGPIQSCRNIVKLMKDEFEFYVFTSDRDLGEEKPYEGIQANQWNSIDGTQVYYAETSKIGIPFIQSLVRNLQPDVIYFNSMFSLKFTILPRIALKSMGYNGKLVLAPRGMLHRGALGLKSRKKKIFLTGFKLLKLHKRVLFHGTDLQEVSDINKVFPGAPVLLANNIPGMAAANLSNVDKETGAVRLVFLSRINPKKKLDFLLERLKQVSSTGKFLLDVYGVSDDPAYLTKCQSLAASLPSSVLVNFKGALPNEQVAATLSQYHFFVLPSLGENFGHAIFEALYSGVPVLISDQTPWLNLAERKAGWDIPLAIPSEFEKRLVDMVNMPQSDWDQWRQGAKKTAESYIGESDFKNKYRQLFI